ncbi:uncharacterized protein LAJ45_11155 [Morchella importuna]|uniref:uncharacterized protein n=1 Tax=Morchella importuna TaxID=1174673 RepID=UPI001E8E57B5|nr:uncharacterized protein LAJ45_11155 [Morchella importuna]KAH8144818.1 hypothetical protein LAJ45_11155 [Morchella importuna]
MAIPEHPPARPQLGSPHPSEKVLSRISSFHHPRPRPRPDLNLPPLPPRSPPAALRQAHKAHVLTQRRAAKKNKTITEFTRRAMLQAQGNAETLAPTTTIESPTTELITAAEILTEILPHPLPSRRRGASGLLSSPRPVFALSPAYRARGAGAGSPLMYREVVKRLVMLPTKVHDGGGRGGRERVLDWGVASPGGKRTGSVKKEMGVGKKEVEW